MFFFSEKPKSSALVLIFFTFVFALNLPWKMFHCASLESERYLLISSAFRGILSQVISKLLNVISKKNPGVSIYLVDETISLVDHF